MCVIFYFCITGYVGMYYGFVSGVGITSMTAASMYYIRTATKVDGNEILIAARRSLNSSEDLRSLLGGYVYVGDLAGFRHTYGSWKGILYRRERVIETDFVNCAKVFLSLHSSSLIVSFFVFCCVLVHTVSGIIPKWKPPKIEMIFNVYSGKNEGKSH